MVVSGGPIGLWPSPMPRMASGKIWHSVACSRLSARFTAVQPTNLPAPRSATVPFALIMMLGWSGNVSFTSAPCWECTTKPLPLALATVPPKRIRPAKGFAGACASPKPGAVAHSSSPQAASRGLRVIVVLLNSCGNARRNLMVYIFRPMRQVFHYIQGRQLLGDSARAGDVFDPSTGQIQARVPLGGAAELDAAVQAALAAQPAWAALGAQRRSWVLWRFKALIEQHL